MSSNCQIMVIGVKIKYLNIMKICKCASKIISTNIHYALIIMLCQHRKHAGQAITSKHIPLCFKWHHEVLV